MTRASIAALVLAASVAAVSGQGRPAAPMPVDLDGTWKLNRELSQFPRDLGFGMDVIGGGRTTITDPGGRGGGGTSVSPGLAANRPASREEAENSKQLVNEVRNPPAGLTVASSAGTIVVTNEGGRARTYFPDGREAFTELDAAPVATVTRWEASRLVIRYKVEPGREVRYTVSRKASPPQLIVQAELIERGGRDTAVRVYEPAEAGEPAPAPAERAPQRAPPVIPLPSQGPGAVQPPPVPADAARQVVPAVPASAAPANLDQTPGAELKGLSALGIVVEDLGAEAASCGLRQEAIEGAASKRLSSAGLTVLRNTDEDTYLYIRVITAATATGTCFSRYDAYVYSYTAATLSYGSRPALVQVSLLHKGGLTASAAKGHGDAVTRAITQYVDQFAAQIRDANK
jgi:hypothetical protein